MYYVVLAKTKDGGLCVLSHCFSDMPKWSDFREPDKYPPETFENINDAIISREIAKKHFKIFDINIELG